MSELIEYIEDSCPDCKKQIFATHDRFYKNTAPSLQVWTLLSKLGDPHPDAASYGASFTYIGDNVAGTHPSGSYAGNSINGWIVYSVLSITQPVDDSNGHYWILGQPDSFGTFNFNRVNANIEAPLVNAECISIQEIKEKDSCTGVETYRYVTEDGNGILVDASVFIPNFDEDNIVLNCPEDPKVEYIPHVSGCIRRKTGTITAICSSTTTTYDFSDTDMVGFTITANDGNGNYTIIQEQANTIAHDKFLALLQNVSQTNARTVEDIGPGFIMFNFWSGNVSNVIDYSPTEVQFDIHVEAGVSDTPIPLTAPCVDPVPDSTYQSSATALRSIYDPVPLNTQQANGGTALVFTVTNYTVSYDVIGGSDIIIPAKQILYKDIDGTIIEEFRSVGNISSLIIFNPITDTFSINCEKDPLPNIQEKEVCGTIDGSADSYELIKVYTRDILTGVSTILHYEDNFGNIITGTVAEVCCNCNTLCDYIPTPSIPLEKVSTYGRSITGINGCADKFISNLDIQWQVKVYKNGSVVHNSALSPILASEGSALAWLNANSGGYWLNNNTIPWGTNYNSYYFPGSALADEYLLIVTETTNSNIWCSGSPATSPIRWAFSNKATAFGAPCDNAESFASSDLWADRSGWAWGC